MRSWIDVAVLAKTRNEKGRFVVRSAAGLPFLLEEGDEVAFVPPRTDAPRRAVVKDVRPIDASSAAVLFAGLGDSFAAQDLVGCHCLIKRELVSDSVICASPALWDGWKVVDESVGDVGSVCGLIENPMQSLLEVSRPDGSTVLVPIVDEIVLEVDADASRIRVRLPNGLLSL